jgi:hypothetical protein
VDGRMLRAGVFKYDAIVHQIGMETKGTNG